MVGLWLSMLFLTAFFVKVFEWDKSTTAFEIVSPNASRPSFTWTTVDVVLLCLAAGYGVLTGCCCWPAKKRNEPWISWTT